MPTTGETMLHGNLELNDKPLPGARVLLISADSEHLVASTVTGENGAFSFDSSNAETLRGCIVLAKIQGPVLAVVQDRVEETDTVYSLLVNTHQRNFHTLKGRVISSTTTPSEFDLRLDPVHLSGIPTELEKFFPVVDEQVIDSCFYQQLVESEFEVRVQEGQYRVSLVHFTKWMEAENYSMNSITSDAESPIFIRDAYGSSVLSVDRDRAVTITVVPVRTN